MSLDAMRWALVQQHLKSVDKFILVVMADRADETHCCFPSIKRLSLDTLQDRKTVIAGLKRLVLSGLIRDTGKRKGSTGKVKVYQLVGVPDRYGNASAVANNKHRDVKQNDNSPVNGTTLKLAANQPINGPVKSSQKRNGTENGMIPSFPSNGTVSGTLNSPINGTQNLSVEPIKETISLEKTKTEKYKGIELIDLPDGLSIESARNFIDHRKALKKPLTQHGFSLYLLALQKCTDCGLSLDQIVDETIDAGWQSVKPSWLKNRLSQSGNQNSFGNSAAEDNRPRKELCG